MKRFVLILLLLAAISNRTTAQQNPFEALRKGMEFHSDSLMKVFFESWHQSSKAQRKKPKTLMQREGEEVLEFLLSSENKGKSPAPYILIPSVVKIYLDSNPVLPGVALEAAVKDSLENMFPSEFLGSKTLVNVRKYTDAIDAYIRKNSDMEYVRKFTELSCHEGGCEVMIEPEIYAITFSKNKFSENNKIAVVMCEIDERGWDYTLSKLNGKWEITYRKATWVE